MKPREGTIKQPLILLLMLFPVAVMGRTKTGNDFPLTLRVVGSRRVHLPYEFGPDATRALEISAVIQGQKYELVAKPDWQPKDGLLNPGIYQARESISRYPAPAYESNQVYLLQFPSGKTRKFYLEAVGE